MFTLLSNRTSQQAIKQGWLEKESKHLHVFKRRWVEAYFGDKLCSFSSSSVETPTEIIDLSDINKAYQSNNFLNEFIITYFKDGSIRSRRFRAPTEQEANDWIDFFNQTMDSDQSAHDEQLDNLIMATIHIKNPKKSEFKCEYNADSEVSEHSTNNNNITFHQRTKAWIENASFPADLIGTDNESLINFIEEIAFDVMHNQQYLDVVLECNNNEISVIEISRCHSDN